MILLADLNETVYEAEFPLTGCLLREFEKSAGIPKPILVWLELNGCSGNIISLLDGSHPSFYDLITNMTDLVYSNSLMATEGQEALKKLDKIRSQEYILAVEGAVSTAENGLYNIIGRKNDRPVTGKDMLQLLGEEAKAVIAVGACASHGGVSAAAPNPSKCVGVQGVLKRRVIQLPGCPCHPDWFLGTLAHLLLYGEPELDIQGRPVMFYRNTIHDRCERRSFFDKRQFAKKLGDPECMFELGCKGPVTRIDCPIRRWNARVNWPVGDNTPCIGCAQYGFPDRMEPFVKYPVKSQEE